MMTEYQDRMIGNCPALTNVRNLISGVADSMTTVYIAGETGTGKELVAEALHYQSVRAKEPYVQVNVSEFAPTLLESELFGYVRGAFTGASHNKIGIFESADNGTLFLDEIAEMGRDVQVKLLRVLQTNQLVRVGGDRAKPIEVKVRVVAASSRPLEEYVKERTFREDLFYRLDQVTIELPPLRARGQDIISLADYFLGKANEAERKQCSFSPETNNWMKFYNWPGNVRQLENNIRGAVAKAASEILMPEDFKAYNIKDDNLRTLISASMNHHFLTMVEMERQHLITAMKKVNGNRSRAAKLLGIDRRTIYRLLQRHKLIENEKSEYNISAPSDND